MASLWLPHRIFKTRHVQRLFFIAWTTYSLASIIQIWARTDHTQVMIPDDIELVWVVQVRAHSDISSANTVVQLLVSVSQSTMDYAQCFHTNRIPHSLKWMKQLYTYQGDGSLLHLKHLVRASTRVSHMCKGPASWEGNIIFYFQRISLLKISIRPYYINKFKMCVPSMNNYGLGFIHLVQQQFLPRRQFQLGSHVILKL